jgi:FMN phosphatase YigB (HAD superfamily)
MLQKLFHKDVYQSLELNHVKAIFFDLDGTLIDVDMQRFVAGYLRRLTEQMSELISPVRATQAMHNGVAAMFANKNAGKTLEEVFLEALSAEFDIRPFEYKASLERFCDNDLEELQPLVSGHPMAEDLVVAAVCRGWQVVLATNPIFPRKVVDARVRWGGLNSDRFEHITAYETAHFCKPNPNFFREVLDMLGLEASECLMVGNDPLHDLAACQVGMQTCLLTPWSISRMGVNFKPDWKGRHSELLALLEGS